MGKILFSCYNTAKIMRFIYVIEIDYSMRSFENIISSICSSFIETHKSVSFHNDPRGKSFAAQFVMILTKLNH